MVEPGALAGVLPLTFQADKSFPWGPAGPGT